MIDSGVTSEELRAIDPINPEFFEAIKHVNTEEQMTTEIVKIEKSKTDNGDHSLWLMSTANGRKFRVMDSQVSDYIKTVMVGISVGFFNGQYKGEVPTAHCPWYFAGSALAQSW